MRNEPSRSISAVGSGVRILFNIDAYSEVHLHSGLFVPDFTEHGFKTHLCALSLFIKLHIFFFYLDSEKCRPR